MGNNVTCCCLPTKKGKKSAQSPPPMAKKSVNEVQPKRRAPTQRHAQNGSRGGEGGRIQSKQSSESWKGSQTKARPSPVSKKDKAGLGRVGQKHSPAGRYERVIEVVDSKESQKIIEISKKIVSV